MPAVRNRPAPTALLVACLAVSALASGHRAFPAMVPQPAPVPPPAPPPARAAASGTTDPLAGARSMVLDNGLTVVLRPDATHPVVAVQMYYRAGARNETTGITGIAHYVEHMLFRGTEGFGLEDVTGVIERAGGEWHGYTWLDGTTYFEAAPRNLLPTLLRLEAERMTRARMAPAEVDPERGAVFQEYRGYQLDPRSDLFDAVMALLFQQHPYRNNTMGWESDLAGITHADLVAFYRRYYGPRNAVLAIAGDFDAAAAETQVREVLGTIPAGGDDTSIRTVEPPLDGPRRVTLVRPGASPAIVVSFLAPAPARPRDYATLALLDAVLASARGLSFYHHSGDQTGGGEVDPFARLASVTTPGPAASLGTAFVPTVYPGHYSIYAAPRAGRSLTEVEAAIFAALAEASASITDEEVAAARARIAAADRLETDSPVEVAHELAFWTALGGPEARRHVMESIGIVSVGEVRSFAASLQPRRAAVGLLMPPTATPAAQATEGESDPGPAREAGPASPRATASHACAPASGFEAGAKPPAAARRAGVTTVRLPANGDATGGLERAVAVVDARPGLGTFVLRLALAPSPGNPAADPFVARLAAAAGALEADTTVRAGTALCGVAISVKPPGDGRFDERDSLQIEIAGPAEAFDAAVSQVAKAIGPSLRNASGGGGATANGPTELALGLLDAAVRETRTAAAKPLPAGSAGGKRAASADLAIGLVAPLAPGDVSRRLEILARRIDTALRRPQTKAAARAPAGGTRSGTAPFAPGRRAAALPGIPQGRLLLAVPGDGDAAARDAVAWLLHHNYSGRLGVRAIAETGLVYDMDSEATRRGPGLVLFAMGADPLQLERLDTELQGVLDGAASGFTEAEVAAYRTYASGRTAVRLAHPDQAARLWTSVLLAGGDDATPAREAARAASLSLRDVTAAAGRMLARDRRLSVIVGRDEAAGGALRLPGPAPAGRGAPAGWSTPAGWLAPTEWAAPAGAAAEAGSAPSYGEQDSASIAARPGPKPPVPHGFTARTR